MKKMIIAMAVLCMSLTSVYAQSYAMKHANPMPNLVRYALGNAELLQLNAEQIKGIKSWAKENKPKMRALVKLVMSEERALLHEALTADNDVVKNADKMLETRKEIIRLKTLCRANLKATLSEKQYAQVIGIYKSTLPKSKNCKAKK